LLFLHDILRQVANHVITRLFFFLLKWTYLLPGYITKKDRVLVKEHMHTHTDKYNGRWQSTAIRHDKKVMIVTPDFTGKTECISRVRQDQLHTHDRQNECNTIAVTKRSRVKPVQYSLLHPERWTRRSNHNDN
jgi:hypothetical protein